MEPHRVCALTEQPFVYSRGREFIITASLEVAGENEEEEGLIIFWKARIPKGCSLYPSLQSVRYGTQCGIRR